MKRASVLVFLGGALALELVACRPRPSARVRDEPPPRVELVYHEAAPIIVEGRAAQAAKTTRALEGRDHAEAAGGR